MTTSEIDARIKALPECCRARYVRNLCYEAEAFMDEPGALALAARDWKLLTATDEQRERAYNATMERHRKFFPAGKS